jgi:hypothetical protein
LAEIVYGTFYSDAVKAVDDSPNPYNVTYSIASGAFPSGITLDGPTGQVTGTTNTDGPWNVTIRAQNEFGGVLQNFSGDVALPPDPPTFVSQSRNSGTSSTVSISIPTRQNGDIAILSFSSYVSSIPPFALSPNSQGPSASNWNLVSDTYFGGSVTDGSTGNVYRIDYGLHQTYYRVMTNTSTDNFSYTLPQSHAWICSVLIVRGQPGHSFSAGGGYAFGTTPFLDDPVYIRDGSFSKNNRPKSITLNYHVREMSPSGTAQAYVVDNYPGNGGYSIGSVSLNGGPAPTLTNAESNSSRIVAYKHDLQEPLANAISLGPYTNVTSTEVWLMGSFGYLEWFRT